MIRGEAEMKALCTYCIRCGAGTEPVKARDLNPLRWEMPPGWVLVQKESGEWGRHCPACNEEDRQRFLACLRSVDRMPLILKTVYAFWRQYPERQLGEVIALAAKLRRTNLTELSDSELAAVLRVWTLSESDRAYEQRHNLAPIEPWPDQRERHEEPAPALRVAQAGRR
jgi:hypothetical protein